VKKRKFKIRITWRNLLLITIEESLENSCDLGHSNALNS